jgi:hypothetical protein
MNDDAGTRFSKTERNRATNSARCTRDVHGSPAEVKKTIDGDHLASR